MKNFKPGQKVVFSTKDVPAASVIATALDTNLICPKEGEMVTVAGSVCEGKYILAEYPRSRRGQVQNFTEKVLFPLDEYSDHLTAILVQKIEKSIYKPVKI